MKDCDGFILPPKAKMYEMTKINAFNYVKKTGRGGGIYVGKQLDNESQINKNFEKGYSAINKDNKRMNMDWIIEKWLPIRVEFKGSVKSDKLPGKFSLNALLKNKFSKDTEIIKLSTNITAEDFVLSNKKVTLIFDKVSVKTPLFIFWEFDEFTPWLINPDENNEFKTSFMVPPGTWRVFFTTQLG